MSDNNDEPEDWGHRNCKACDDVRWRLFQGRSRIMYMGEDDVQLFGNPPTTTISRPVEDDTPELRLTLDEFSTEYKQATESAIDQAVQESSLEFVYDPVTGKTVLVPKER